VKYIELSDFLFYMTYITRSTYVEKGKKETASKPVKEASKFGKLGKLGSIR
jgi:hypothetical protein